PDVLEHELQAAVARPQDAERPRQVRALVDAPAPALDGGEHEELAGPRGRAAGVGDLEHDIGAELAAPGDGERPAPEWRERAAAGGRGHRAASARAPPAWSSWSDSTGGAPWRAAEIARAAASPPDSVVRHGTP